ncbi:MAG TPA: sodium:solute symporter family protein [Methanomassiliicoccales archaeon]|nr:sodium:solute symporter family protein [Methanomassiliicoccales archaeon]
MVDSGLVWGATIVYVVIMGLLGYLGWRRTKSGSDFLLAGKNVHPFIIGLSYGSTFISTSAIVGFGGFAGAWGLGIVWLAGLNIALGLLFAFVFFGKRVRKIGQKLKSQTFPELLGSTYNSSFIRWFVAVVILLGMPLYAAAVLIGGSTFMYQVIPGLDFNGALIVFTFVTAAYVITGGLRAVMYTDAFQGVLMIVGMTAIFLITMSLLGGFDSANQQLTNLAPQVPATYKAQGMVGWTAFPTLGSDNWITLVTTIILPVGIGVLAQPQLAVRFMTAKDSKALNRSIPFGGVFLVMTVGLAYLIGAWSNVYFWDNFGQVSIVKAGSINNIIPAFINASQDQVIVVIFMLTLLAAAMSTLSSLFHVMGSAAGYDLFSVVTGRDRFKKYATTQNTAKGSLRVNQVATLIVIFVSFVLAAELPRSGGIIAIATSMFFGVCASAFLPLFVQGLFAKRPSVLAAKLSLAIGAVAWVLWTTFACKTTASVFGVVQALTGKPSIFTGALAVIDPILIALPLSTLTLIVVWVLDKNSRMDGRGVAGA